MGVFCCWVGEVFKGVLVVLVLVLVFCHRYLMGAFCCWVGEVSGVLVARWPALEEAAISASRVTSSF